MKRISAIAFILTLVFSLAACDGNVPDEIVDPETPPVVVETHDFTLATGGTGGTYFPYGTAIASELTAAAPNLTLTAVSTGASVENARLLGREEVDFAILQNDILDYAYGSYELFENDDNYSNLTTVATLYPEVIQIVVTRDSGIETVEGLKNMRISVGAAGSGTEANARQILGAYGIEYTDLDVSYLSFSESAMAIENDQLDAFFCTAGVPNISITNLNSVREVRILSIASEKIQQLEDEYGFYTSYAIDAGVYGESVETVAVMATLACRSDIDEDIVYEMTKALFERKAAIAALHEKGKELSLETATEAVSVPLHPGAARYYQEAGVS